jgi:uncharacterized tellurite resistance protein B-like protein
MSVEDSIGLVKALGFIAWTDERIVPEEKEMLGTVMDALNIPAERRRQLCQSLHEAPPTLEAIASAFTDDTERRFAVAQAILMAQVDGAITLDEKRDIGKLAGALGIATDELEILYAAVELTGDIAGSDMLPTPETQPESL